MPRQKQVKKEDINFDKAFEVHSRICDREQARRALLVDNIKDLVWMFDTQSYKGMLGSNPPPVWAGYLGLVEIYYSRSEVERWRRIWHYFQSIDVKLQDLFDVPETRLEDIAKIAPDSQKALELYGQAKVLGSLEWRNALAEFQGKPTSDECVHQFRVEQKCKKCGIIHPVEVPKE